VDEGSRVEEGSGVEKCSAFDKTLGLEVADDVGIKVEVEGELEGDSVVAVDDSMDEVGMNCVKEGEETEEDRLMDDDNFLEEVIDDVATRE
jgi:hypothetical protein